MLLLKDYLNNKSSKGGNLTVHGPYLWDEIAKLRGNVMPSSPIRTAWKLLAGCSKTKGKYPNLEIVPDGRHYLTPREAAAIVMLALWTQEVGAIVDPELGVESIQAEQLEPLFDRWMLEAVSEPAKKVLGLIERSQQLTYEILESSINSEGKKPIPQSTLRGWVVKNGGKFRKHDRCPLHIASAIWAEAQRLRADQKSAAA